MPPEEDARASLDPAFARETWGFLAQQCVEYLLKGLIVLADQQPPLSHDLARLQLLAGARLPEDLLELPEFAVKARDSPEDTPLPARREQLLALIHQRRAVLETRLDGINQPPQPEG